MSGSVSVSVMVPVSQAGRQSLSQWVGGRGGWGRVGWVGVVGWWVSGWVSESESVLEGVLASVLEEKGERAGR